MRSSWPSRPPGGTGLGKPTGIIFNGSNQFVLTQGGVTGHAIFIFATEGGTIAGWFPAINFTHAITVVDNSRSEAIYKGLAFSGDGTRLLLYATDFHNGKIDVFDNTFSPVSLPGSFEDPGARRREGVVEDIDLPVVEVHHVPQEPRAMARNARPL